MILSVLVMLKATESKQHVCLSRLSHGCTYVPSKSFPSEKAGLSIALLVRDRFFLFQLKVEEKTL